MTNLLITAALMLGGPDSGTEESRVIATVDALLGAVSRRDEAAGMAQLRPSGTATVLFEKPDGTVVVRSVALKTFAEATAGPEKYDERMLDRSVKIEGAMAMVWGRYVFAIDGKRVHCGTEHFDLVKEAGHWKIQNITWSVRTAGCED